MHPSRPIKHTKSLVTAISHADTVQSLELRAHLADLRNDVLYLHRLRKLTLTGSPAPHGPGQGLALLARLPRLRSLDVVAGPDGRLPEGIGQLEQLRSLTVRSPEFEATEALTTLPNLYNLTILGGPLRDPDDAFRIFARMPKLSRLALPGQALPTAISGLARLRVLRIHGLRQLPEAIATLSGLRELYLDRFVDTEGFRHVFTLTGLRRLEFRGHPREASGTLPPGLEQLRGLETLHISHTGLEHFPGKAGPLPKLETLELPDNALTDLSGIERFTALRTLNVRKNPLQAFPPHFFHLRHLETIHADFCKFREVQGLLGRMPSLKLLNFDKNDIARIGEEFFGSRSLEHLDLNRNKLGKYPEALTAMPGLHKVYLGNNPFYRRYPRKELDRELKALFEWRHRYDLRPDTVEYLAEWLQMASPPLVSELDTAELLAALNLPLPYLHMVVRLQLDQRIPDPVREANDMRIALCGRFQSFLRKDAIAWLKAAGFTVVRRPAHADICILGNRFSRRPEHLLASGCVPALETHLVRRMNAAPELYLLQDSPERPTEIANLRRLLGSGQDDSRRFALTLMETAGVPPELLVYLVHIVRNQATEKPVRHRYQRMLYRFGWDMIRECTGTPEDAKLPEWKQDLFEGLREWFRGNFQFAWRSLW